MAAAFADWGLPTADALAAARSAAPGLPVVASGGLRDGVDVAKCLALGATAAGLARPLLLAARPTAPAKRSRRCSSSCGSRPGRRVRRRADALGEAHLA